MNLLHVILTFLHHSKKSRVPHLYLYWSGLVWPDFVLHRKKNINWKGHWLN